MRQTITIKSSTKAVTEKYRKAPALAQADKQHCIGELPINQTKK